MNIPTHDNNGVLINQKLAANCLTLEAFKIQKSLLFISMDVMYEKLGRAMDHHERGFISRELAEAQQQIDEINFTRQQMVELKLAID